MIVNKKQLKDLGFVKRGTELILDLLYDSFLEINIDDVDEMVKYKSDKNVCLSLRKQVDIIEWSDELPGELSLNFTFTALYIRLESFKTLESLEDFINILKRK